MRLAAVLCAATLASCGLSPSVRPEATGAGAGTTSLAADAFHLQPLPVQQQQAYPETVTGRFVSLADFEGTALVGAQAEAAQDEPGLQLDCLEVRPGAAARLRHVLNITRTGTGAMEVLLPSGAALAFHSPYIHDFRPYTLLSLAVYSRAVRDDLVISLVGPTGTWETAGQLVAAGWNTVMIDLARLRKSGAFDLADVRTVTVRFALATEAVTINLDDIILIDNARRISGTPAGIDLHKAGLDYTLKLPGRERPIRIAQDDDGLWRLGPDQCAVRLTGRGDSSAATGQSEDLRPMGQRRVGAVELLEVNPIRLRIRNTWYFPPQAGEWTDMDVRQIRWEHTFYADGRWVTGVMLNNAGGGDISAVQLIAPEPVAWSNGGTGDQLRVEAFSGPVGQWALLAAPVGPAGDAFRAGFARPAEARSLLGARGAQAAGDAQGDGFDESQGCYFARAVRGNCRIELKPGDTPLVRPVIRVAGPWRGAVAGNCAGLPLRPIIKLPDGILTLIEDTITNDVVVEFAGRVDLLDE